MATLLQMFTSEPMFDESLEDTRSLLERRLVSLFQSCQAADGLVDANEYFDALLRDQAIRQRLGVDIIPDDLHGKYESMTLMQNIERARRLAGGRISFEQFQTLFRLAQLDQAWLESRGVLPHELDKIQKIMQAEGSSFFPKKLVPPVMQPRPVHQIRELVRVEPAFDWRMRRQTSIQCLYKPSDRKSESSHERKSSLSAEIDDRQSESQSIDTPDLSKAVSSMTVQPQTKPVEHIDDRPAKQTAATFTNLPKPKQQSTSRVSVEMPKTAAVIRDSQTADYLEKVAVERQRLSQNTAKRLSAAVKLTREAVEARARAAKTEAASKSIERSGVEHMSRQMQDRQSSRGKQQSK